MLAELGHDTTISYLHAMCELVIRETSLMPHVNCRRDVATGDGGLRDVSVSQGIMLETASARLCEKGQVHHGSPDKHPAVRLENIRMAGELSIPFTTGILIGNWRDPRRASRQSGRYSRSSWPLRNISRKSSFRISGQARYETGGEIRAVA